MSTRVKANTYMKKQSIYFKLNLFFILILPIFILADTKSELIAMLQSLSNESHSDNHVRCGLIDNIRLQQIVQQASPEIQALAKQSQLFERPARQDSAFSVNRYFIMHFDRTGPHAVPEPDIEGNGIPDYIDSAGVYLEKSWDMQIDQLGFYPPPGIDGNPIQVYPVYFTDFLTDYGKNYYGLTTQESIVEYNGVTGQAYTSFVELHNDYESSAFYSNGLEGLKVTAAHEFNHAIQYGYFTPQYIFDIYEDPSAFFMEMTSTWLEDYVFDEVNDYVFYLDRLFNRLFGINFTSVSGYYPYANCLYIHMLEKQYGPDIIVDIWNRIIEKPALDALDDELVFRNSSFAESQNQYAAWLYFTGSRSQPNLYFPEGAAYPEVKLDEGLDAFEKGLVGKGVRLIELIPQMKGLVTAKVSSGFEGEFSHILHNQHITKPHEFNSKELLTFNINEPVIIVLSNPNDEPISDLEYEVKREKVTTSSDPLIISSGSNQIQFSNVPEDATIKIFNILGQKIQTIFNQTGNQVQWNLRNHFGNRVPSGTYIYFVKSDDFESTGKLTILK